MTSLDPETARHIGALSLNPDRPLLICDVDEVVVHFIRALEDFLETRGLWLNAASFALNGNIKCRNTQTPLDDKGVGAVLLDFFKARTATLEPIDHAVASLDGLSTGAQIVMLTNLPAAFSTARRENLASFGLHFPLIANQGPKGPAVAALTRDHRSSIAFIDDNPSYLKSVHEHCPRVGLVHFMQDQRFARHVPPLPFTDSRTDNWPSARAQLAALLSP